MDALDKYPWPVITCFLNNGRYSVPSFAKVGHLPRAMLLVLPLLVLSQSELMPLKYCTANNNNNHFVLRLSIVINSLRLVDGE